eukprot:m.27050 g.27050  ORF g.27050 m.27050 type:complete len:366 (-) comp15654_c0_seq1:129-1226(-)
MEAHGQQSAAPTLQRVQGELKAAKAEVVRLQHQLQKFTREHHKQLDAIRYMLKKGGVGVSINQTSSPGKRAPTETAHEETTAQTQETQSQQDDKDPNVQTTNNLHKYTETVSPIGLMESCFVRLNGTPRQGSICPSAKSRLKIQCFPNGELSLEGLELFSHVWIVFLFHLNKNTSVKPKVTPPKLGGTRVGVFSTRAPYRPNPIGLSLARLEKIEGDTLYFSGADLLDGTPVIDIKPHIPMYDNVSSDNSRIPMWLQQSQDPQQHLEVVLSEKAQNQITSLEKELIMFDNAHACMVCIRDVLKTDPRSIYRKTKCQDQLYPLILDSLHMMCEFVDDKVTVLEVQLVKDTLYADNPLNITNLPLQK